MARSTPESSITKATLESAVRRARDGEVGEIRDAACPGLVLRLRGGRVAWTYRGRIGKENRRWTLGGPDVPPEEARRRCWRVKDCLRSGMDPTALVREMVTGITMARQDMARDQQSWLWEKAVKEFLVHKFETRRGATYDDYKKFLNNTPELKRFKGRYVSTITDVDVSRLLADVGKRAESYAEHLQRVISSMWTYLADGARRTETGVKPHIMRGVRAQDRRRSEIGDDREDEPLPDKLQLGRVIAIAKLGVFGPVMSNGILMLAGAFQRRRSVVGAHADDLQWFNDEILWRMPPFFRKTAHKRRSESRHLVPLVGFAAAAAGALNDLSDGWLMPIRRVAKAGKAPRAQHMNVRTISRALESIPGVKLSTHVFRRAAASYGPAELGWHRDDAKLILDHMEGHDAQDVTAQHYNSDPALVKKREMMRQWTDWLEKQEAAAIAADPILLDRDAVAELVYKKRYGERRWRAALKAARDGKLPWAA